ncbi:hypothetical protein [Streptomyces cellulosae]|nr:hypothetical protein [Streptomyces cellulosae]
MAGRFRARVLKTTEGLDGEATLIPTGNTGIVLDVDGGISIGSSVR